MFRLSRSSSTSSLRRELLSRVAAWIRPSTLVAAGLLAGAGPALAGNANVTITVDSIPAQVSVGRPGGLATYAAYKVTITSATTNVINGVIFDLPASVTGYTLTNNAPVPVATYVETVLKSMPQISCGPGTAPITVHCDIGQLTGQGSPGSVASFVLLLRAPALSTNVSFDPNPAVSTIAGTWTARYSNGSVSSTQTPNSLVCNQSTVPGDCHGDFVTGLITTDTDAVLSALTTYVPSLGGTFFTGNGVSALSSSLRATATTKLTIPPGLGLSTAQVTQQLPTVGGPTAATTTTNLTVVAVPNGNNLFSNYVTVELRRDASTIKAGSKIDVVPIYYAHFDNTNPVVELQSCKDSAFYPLVNGPSAALPVCVWDRIAYTKKTAPTADDVGDWVFIIRALENGGFRY